MKDLIVLCPINSTTEVQSLSIQSMEPTTTSTQTNTEYASYLYTSVNALGGISTCTGAESALNPGITQLLITPVSCFVLRSGRWASDHDVATQMCQRRNTSCQKQTIMYYLQAQLLLYLETVVVMSPTRLTTPCSYQLVATTNQ